MSRYDPSAKLPASNMSAYLSNAPKDPIAQAAAAEFVKGKPPIVQAAKDWRYYETTITTMHQVEGAVLKEYKDGGSWREHYKTWRDACVPLGKSKRQIDRLIQEDVESRTECPIEPLSEKAVTLEVVNELPDPLAELEAQIAKPAVRAGPAPEPPPVALKPAAVQAEHKPRVRNDSGKPIYAMPVWREVEDGCGKLINRADALNHLCPNKEKHQRLRTALHSAFDEIQSWHELARNHHA